MPQKPTSKKTTRKKTTLSDTSGLTQLGSGAKTKPSRALESFPFHHKGRDTKVSFYCDEFTCHCPLTGQPDFAKIEVHYIPNDRALESKSLKQYLWSFRDERGFHEDVVNVILDDLHKFLEPKWIQVVGRFNIRGGISIVVEAELPQK